jgi:uncharacterized Zn-finger protein
MCTFPGCNKRFTQSSNLTAHEKTHYNRNDEEGRMDKIKNESDGDEPMRERGSGYRRRFKRGLRGGYRRGGRGLDDDFSEYPSLPQNLFIIRKVEKALTEHEVINTTITHRFLKELITD